MDLFAGFVFGFDGVVLVYIGLLVYCLACYCVFEFVCWFVFVGVVYLVADLPLCVCLLL